MKTILASLFLPVALAGIGCGGAAPIKNEEALNRIKTVAVFPFTAGPATQGAKPGDALAGAVIERIRLDMPQWKVIERSRVADLVAEMQGRSAGVLSDKDLAAVGKLLNAEAIVVGSVVEYSRDEPTKDNGYPMDYTVGATIRIVSASDADVIWTGRADAAHYRNFSDAVLETARLLVYPLKPLAGGRPGGH